MKIIFLHFLLFLSLLLFEFAFFGVVFTSFPAPLLIMSAAVIWTLLVGFQRALFFTVPLTVLYGVLLSGGIQPFSAYMVLVIYAVSFLSKRLVVEHQGLATLLHAGILAGAAGGYQVLLALLSQRSLIQPFLEYSFLSFTFLALIVFWVLYVILERFMLYIERLRTEQVLFTR